MLRVRQSRESLRESVFTGVQASPPNRNSFHVSSSLPACPYTNVHGGRLNHLLMSFPQLSLTITSRNNMVSDARGFNLYGACTVNRVTYTMSTGLKDELSRDKATETEHINILHTPAGNYTCEKKKHGNAPNRGS